MTRTGSIAIVILAAGSSSRMGQAKQIVEVDGIPMVLRATTVALKSMAAQVVVVTGAYAAEVSAIMEPLCRHYPARIQLIQNDEWPTGQASTVRCAVAYLASRCDALLFLPVDQPFVPVALLDQLISVWQGGALLAAPAVNGQARGAPAIFDHTLFADLLELKGDVGARPLLRRYHANLVTIPAQAAWLRDLDTPDDLSKALSPE